MVTDSRVDIAMLKEKMEADMKIEVTLGALTNMVASDVGLQSFLE